jgi:hypothetical protein
MRGVPKASSVDIADPIFGSAAFLGWLRNNTNTATHITTSGTIIELLRRLYRASYDVDSGLRRECDHATYEGNTEAVDDLREILQILEDNFSVLVHEPMYDLDE